MRLARALGSMPHLRRQLVPTARSRVVRGRMQWNLSTGVEQPARGVSSVKVKPTLADQTPLASSLTLWVIRGLIAGLVFVALIPNLVLGVIFCAGYALAELRGRWRGMRIARAIGSMPHLRRQLVPTVRPRRRRLQWNFNTAVEKPTQGVSWVNVKPDLAYQTAPLSSLTLSLIRALVAGLVLIALIPNLMLGAIFWLGAVDIPRSKSPMITANDKPIASPSAVPTPVLSSPPSLEASPGADITLSIALDGTDGVPARSIIAVKGLPQGSKLSSGRPYDETEWNLKTDEIGDLQLILPGEASGEAKLLIQLVTPEGAVIADTATVLKLTADATLNAGASNIKTEPESAQVLDQPNQEPERTGVDERLANQEAARVAPEDPVPLPSRRPVQTATVDDAGTTWIKPLAYVNLRQRPTRSAPAVGVVEKGVKLRVVGRKNRWVRVANPANSEMGWIYAGNVSTVR
jgi:Bacterial SH3 domain